MSGQYRGIGLQLLDEEEFQELSADARWILIVLMISLGPSGIERRYQASLTADLAARTGASPRKVEARLRELAAAGWVKRDGSLFWVVRQLELDPLLAAINEKHAKSIRRHLASLPRCPLTLEFVARYAAWFPTNPWDGQGSPNDSLSEGQRCPTASGRREGAGRDGGNEDRPSSGEGTADAVPLTREQRRDFLKAGFAALNKTSRSNPPEEEGEDEFVRAGRKLDAERAARRRTAESGG